MKRYKNLKFYVPREKYRNSVSPVGFSLSCDGIVCHFWKDGNKSYSKITNEVTGWFYEEVSEEEFVLLI